MGGQIASYHCASFKDIRLQLGLTRGSGGQETIGSAGYLKMNLGMRDGDGFGCRTKLRQNAEVSKALSK